MRLWPRRQGSSLDLLVVGLGNPGREYARNRHNVGAMVADELARRHGGSWRSKFSGRIAEIRLDGHKIALLTPETYMNESGRSVGAAAAYFKVAPDAVLVVHDESDLELGRLQLRLGGGLAGHNGLRSIAQHLKTQEFLRLRVGPRELRAARGRGGARRACRGRRRDARRRGRRARPGPGQPALISAALAHGGVRSGFQPEAGGDSSEQLE
ncbi:MAG: aminoacyl-tRNA hydrolase [Actinobacteria bacterium]|nr:MAG: aminoacyl-tRNA hydrolase [Actinomycetota bacterium]